MRIAVDVDHCIGAGQCVLSAPAVFDQTEEGLVELLMPEPGAEQAEAVEQAGRYCPSGSVHILRD